MQETNGKESELLTETAAAELVSLSVHWFRRARWDGSGPPFIKMSRAVRYRRGTLLEWFAARERTSTTSAEV